MLTTKRLAISILFIGLLAMAMRVAVDTDTFWHLRAGAWMLEHRQLLNFDVFSHTRYGQAWVNHSWLSELGMAAVFAVGGFNALNIATALIIWLTFVFVYLSGEGNPLMRAFAVVLAAATSGVYWSARPQIVSLLLTAVFGYVLIQFRLRQINRLWLLPLLMVLWVNLHGGFALGFILLAITIGGEGWGMLWRDTRPRATANTTELTKIFFWCVLAAAINPYGAQMLAYPFRTVSIGVLQNYIQEWQSPNFHAREAQVFIVMWVATFGVVGAGRRLIGMTDFLLFAAFTALALLAGRNIAAFAVVAAPILMRHGNSALAQLRDRLPAPSPAAQPLSSALLRLNWALLTIVAAAAIYKMTLPLNPQTVNAAIEKYAPVGAAAYLQTNPPAGKMFNAYNFGGYLVWALYPQTPVFVDGRTDLYDDALLTEYLNTYLTGDGWEESLATYDISVVVVESESPIARALAARPDWQVMYRDSLAVVIQKVGQ